MSCDDRAAVSSVCTLDSAIPTAYDIHVATDLHEAAVHCDDQPTSETRAGEEDVPVIKAGHLASEEVVRNKECNDHSEQTVTDKHGRKSVRLRTVKRSYSPDHKLMLKGACEDAKKRRRKSVTPRKLGRTSVDRPCDRLPNGNPFSCDLCQSPYVVNTQRGSGTKRSRHTATPRHQYDQVTARVLVLCNACALSYDRPHKKRDKVPPSPEQKQEHLESGKKFAQKLAQTVGDSAAERLYCPSYKLKPCDCLQKYLSVDADQLKSRAQWLIELTKEAQHLRKLKCYDDVGRNMDSGDSSKRSRSIGLGNGHKRSTYFVNFVMSKRTELKQELKLCECATQRILLYSNNFLHKKLKTEQKSARIKRQKGKAALGQLPDLSVIHEIRCCGDNCVNLALTHVKLLDEWRTRAALCQAEARRVLAEMLTPVAGSRPNCYKFISWVTGSSMSTVSNVNEQIRVNRGSREPPIHGMKKFWQNLAKQNGTVSASRPMMISRNQTSNVTAASAHATPRINQSAPPAQAIPVETAYENQRQRLVDILQQLTEHQKQLEQQQKQVREQLQLTLVQQLNHGKTSISSAAAAAGPPAGFGVSAPLAASMSNIQTNTEYQQYFQGLLPVEQNLAQDILQTSSEDMLHSPVISLHNIDAPGAGIPVMNTHQLPQAHSMTLSPPTVMTVVQPGHSVQTQEHVSTMSSTTVRPSAEANVSIYPLSIVHNYHMFSPPTSATQSENIGLHSDMYQKNLRSLQNQIEQTQKRLQQVLNPVPISGADKKTRKPKSTSNKHKQCKPVSKTSQLSVAGDTQQESVIIKPSDNPARIYAAVKQSTEKTNIQPKPQYTTILVNTSTGGPAFTGNVYEDNEMQTQNAHNISQFEGSVFGSINTTIPVSSEQFQGQIPVITVLPYDGSSIVPATLNDINHPNEDHVCSANTTHKGTLLSIPVLQRHYSHSEHNSHDMSLSGNIVDISETSRPLDESSLAVVSVSSLPQVPSTIDQSITTSPMIGITGEASRTSGSEVSETLGNYVPMISSPIADTNTTFMSTMYPLFSTPTAEIESYMTKDMSDKLTLINASGDAVSYSVDATITSGVESIADANPAAVNEVPHSIVLNMPVTMADGSRAMIPAGTINQSAASAQLNKAVSDPIYQNNQQNIMFNISVPMMGNFASHDLETMSTGNSSNVILSSEQIRSSPLPLSHHGGLVLSIPGSVGTSRTVSPQEGMGNTVLFTLPIHIEHLSADNQLLSTHPVSVDFQNTGAASVILESSQSASSLLPSETLTNVLTSDDCHIETSTQNVSDAMSDNDI